MPASRAVELTRIPLAPPPQRKVTSSAFSIFENALPRRTTTPGTPESRTIMLEPRPSAITGTSGSSSRRKWTRSPSSFGSNSHCAAPPLLNHTNGASGAFPSACLEPAGASRRSLARPDLGQAVTERGGPLGNVARAHADDEVARRRKITQPAQRSSMSFTVRTMRWPCARRPSASASESLPSIGCSPAA